MSNYSIRTITNVDPLFSRCFLSRYGHLLFYNHHSICVHHSLRSIDRFDYAFHFQSGEQLTIHDTEWEHTFLITGRYNLFLVDIKEKTSIPYATVWSLTGAPLIVRENLLKELPPLEQQKGRPSIEHFRNESTIRSFVCVIRGPDPVPFGFSMHLECVLNANKELVTGDWIILEDHELIQRDLSKIKKWITTFHRQGTLADNVWRHMHAGNFLIDVLFRVDQRLLIIKTGTSLYLYQNDCQRQETQCQLCDSLILLDQERFLLMTDQRWQVFHLPGKKEPPRIAVYQFDVKWSTKHAWTNVQFSTLGWFIGCSPSNHEFQLIRAEWLEGREFEVAQKVKEVGIFPNVLSHLVAEYLGINLTMEYEALRKRLCPSTSDWSRGVPAAWQHIILQFVSNVKDLVQVNRNWYQGFSAIQTFTNLGNRVVGCRLTSSSKVRDTSEFKRVCKVKMFLDKDHKLTLLSEDGTLRWKDGTHDLHVVSHFSLEKSRCMALNDEFMVLARNLSTKSARLTVVKLPGLVPVAKLLTDYLVPGQHFSMWSDQCLLSDENVLYIMIGSSIHRVCLSTGQSQKITGRSEHGRKNLISELECTWSKKGIHVLSRSSKYDPSHTHLTIETFHPGSGKSTLWFEIKMPQETNPVTLDFAATTHPFFWVKIDENLFLVREGQPKHVLQMIYSRPPSFAVRDDVLVVQDLHKLYSYKLLRL